MSVGVGELLLIVAVVLLLFGGSRFGAIGKGLGEGIHNFKKGLAGEPEADETPPKDPPQLPAKSAAEPTEPQAEPVAKKTDDDA